MERDAMSLTELMADFLSADRKPVIEADPSGVDPSCLNSSGASHDGRHNEEAEGLQSAVDETSPRTSPKSVPASTKAKIYTAMVDDKVITLIDTNDLPFEELVSSVKGRFGENRVRSILSID